MFDPVTIALIVAIVLVAGTLTGIAGFGFALVGTMALATLVPPSIAVVVLIIPILATNLSLLDELDRESVRTCGRRFFPYVLSVLIGTIVGMALLESVPAEPLLVTLGLLTLAYVGTQTISIPGISGVKDRCFVEQPRMMVALGTVSGFVFGATNVGVQIVAYVQSRDLPQHLFVGVIALIFVGVNATRVGVAGVFGLYPSVTVVLLSVALSVPTVVGVFVGRRIRPLLTDRTKRLSVLSLLAVIGVRLVLGGLGIV